MSYYVRKFKPSSWPDGKNNEYTGIDSLSAAAFFDLLKNGENISFWKIDSFDDLKFAAAALFSCAESKLNGKMKFFYLSDEDIKNNGFIVNQNSDDANTILDNLKGTHFNACELCYSSLGTLADIIARRINSLDVKMVTDKKVYAVLAGYVDKQLVNIDAFSPEIQEEVKKYTNNN